MAEIQSQKRCSTCGRPTLHARHTFSGGMGCLLSVLTAGLFIPVWLLIGVYEGLTVKWHCQVCGEGKRI